MTREEVINFLKNYLDETVYTEKCRNAHKMAIEALENEFCEAGHILYDNINNIEWKHLPKPIAEYYDEVMRYYYLGDELYFFKYTGVNVTWSEYFISKGDSPWNAIRNHFRWSNERYKSLRNYSLTK